MPAILRIDQNGDGTPGFSRIDGTSDGATITLRNVSPGQVNSLEWYWLPLETSALPTINEDTPGEVWSLSLPPGDWGGFLWKLTVDGSETVRGLYIPSPVAGLIASGLGERGDRNASLIKAGAAEIAASVNNAPIVGTRLSGGNYAAWWPHQDKLLRTVEAHALALTSVPDNADVVQNTNDIATNAAAIATNTSDIATNASNIATNTSDVATNTSDIATNTASIATNASNIATNTANIATNTANVATNTSDIATNTSDIATNASDISTNAGDIATNASNIANKVNTRYGFGAGSGPGSRTLTTADFPSTEVVNEEVDSSGGVVTITLPDNAAGIPLGSSRVFRRKGGNNVTFAAGGGATIDSEDSFLSITKENGLANIVYVAVGRWHLSGNLG